MTARRRLKPEYRLAGWLKPAALCLALLACSTASPAASHGAEPQFYGGRSMLVYVPSQLPAAGSRTLVVVLHGGLGNAQRIESMQTEHGLNLDAAAEQHSFLVAYLNGTPVTRLLGNDKLGWNAGGGCCGRSASSNIDDVSYIKGAIDFLASRYGVNRSRVYGMGHSNGAMMTLRMVCETGVYAAAISISGPLNLDNPNCSAAKGRQILGIHGENDENVPIAGGVGSKGLSRVDFQSEERTRQVFTAAGAVFELQIVAGADHFLDHIDAAMQRDAGMSVAQKAVRFFGLERQAKQ
jgi:poly(3-hydroxybutyrate) depolymerase